MEKGDGAFELRNSKGSLFGLLLFILDWGLLFFLLLGGGSFLFLFLRFGLDGLSLHFLSLLKSSSFLDELRKNLIILCLLLL